MAHQLRWARRRPRQRTRRSDPCGNHQSQPTRSRTHPTYPTHSPTLLDIPGCGALTAAKLVGEIGDPTRFPTNDAFAMFTGTAPIPIWSGSERYRPNRGGNRQLNAAIHRIAITQTRCHPPAQAFITRHPTNGNTKRHATRALKRKLANVIYRTLTTNTTQQPHTNAA